MCFYGCQLTFEQSSDKDTTGKAEVQERRNERFARKNPERVQKQIDDLKAISAGGGKLSRHEEQLLEGLEKEIKIIKKARETLGDQAPSFGRGPRRDQESHVLGKRRRDSVGSSTDEDVPEEVRKIPMPRDTPPPIPKEVLDQWFARRRARRSQENAAKGGGETSKEDEAKKDAAPAASQTVYEAKPVMRDLRKEAVSAFVPAAVQKKLNKGRGQGGLLEPEEADRLEREGYMKTANAPPEATGASINGSAMNVTVEDVDDNE